MNCMGKIKIEVDGYLCEKCKHKWIPKKKKVRPVQCPKCKSARWDEPKRK